MKSLLVSVVIPSFARNHQLDACLSALAYQTFSEPWEVIVVDDESPEPINVRPFLRTVHPLHGDNAPACHSVPVRVIRQSNTGPALARNHGVTYAAGKLIAFTDDDCQPCPTWLENLVEGWRVYPHSLIGGTTINALRTNPCASTSQLIIDLVYEYFNHDHDNAYFLTSNNMLCSKKQFLELGGFDPRFPRAGGEDRDFSDKWRQASFRLVWIKDACIEHYHHQTFAQFINLNIRYGQGAFTYQAARRERKSGTMKEVLGFHSSLPALIVPKLKHRFSLRGILVTICLLLTWQVANLYGFAKEALFELIQGKWRIRADVN